MKRVSANVNYMAAFLIINNFAMKINVGVNAKNQLIKVYVIKDQFGIQVIANANVIDHVMLDNIQTMKTVIVEKGWQINQLKKY